MGVPQGSNIGPLLFMLFVNDFPSCLECTSCNLFADDTAIYCSGTNITEINSTLQVDVKNVVKWFNDNMLTVNIDKSCSIAIGTHQRLNNQTEELNVTVMDDNLRNVNSIKYLGLTIDNNLNWNQHVNNLCLKLSPKIELLRKLKHKLPTEQLITIYKSIIQPHFDYCVSVWGSTSKTNILLLQRLQNRAARIITGMYDWNISARNIVNNLGWMNIKQRIDYFTSLLTFKALNGLTPTYISDTLHIRESSYNVRNANGFNFVVPRSNLELFKQSFLYNAPQLWNNLRSITADMFKTRYKKFLLTKKAPI